MTPAQLLATFDTPQAAYEQTQRNFRSAVTLGRLGGIDWDQGPPWEVLGRHLRTYWAGNHLTGVNIPTTLFRTPGGCQ